MDGKRFSCNIEHDGYDATAGEDVKSTWFEISVVGRGPFLSDQFLMC